MGELLADGLITGETFRASLGATPPEPDWGLAIAESRQYLPEAWWFATFPGLAILVTVLAINLFGDGLRDALDPRLRD